MAEGDQGDGAEQRSWVDFRLGYQPAFDGLRGLGVSTFILYHGVVNYEGTARSWLLPGAYLWLEMFFVQSGFLITSLLLEEWYRTGQIRLRRFYARRAIRLLPALFLVVGVSVAALLILDPWPSDEPWLEVWASLFYFQNWVNALFITDYPYFLNHTWSLSIEEQFYLVVPVAVVVALRTERLRRWALPVVGLGVVLSALWMGLLASTIPEGHQMARLYYGTDTRAQGLLVGVGLAFAIHSGLWLRSAGQRRLVRWWGVMGSAVLVVLLLTADIHERSMYFGVFLLCSTSVAGMLSDIVERPDGWLARSLSWRPLRVAGERTYGLYLWHWPVMLLFTYFVRDWAEFPTIATQIVLAFVVAFASYRFVERPILQRYGPRFARITPEREARHRVARAAPVAAVPEPAGELTAT